MSYTNSEDLHQPAHPCSLIWAVSESLNRQQRSVQTTCCVGLSGPSVSHMRKGPVFHLMEELYLFESQHEETYLLRSQISFRFLHEKILPFWPSKLWPVKILIRLRECAGWSESSLGAHVQRYVFCRCGPCEDSSNAVGLHELFSIAQLKI